VTGALATGVAANRGQIAQLGAQVFLTGLTLGLVRTVVPALAESEFDVARGSALALVSFVVAFGVVKAVMNFVAGRLSERHGRKTVLIWGWIVALPVPVMIWAAPDWGWVVAATALLGVNQGMTWSMSQTMKLDLAGGAERGRAMGINEFAGYGGVAVAGVLTGWAATSMGPRLGLLVVGLAVVGVALALALVAVRETLGYARAEAAAPRGVAARAAEASALPGTAEVFAVMTWRDRRLAALCQAGLVEKFVDALVWIVLPVWLFGQGVGLTGIGWITGTYGMVWGVAQLWTGRLSDRVGRYWPNVGGMWLCGAGVALFPLGEGMAWWAFAAAVTGLGMALLYPNLGASVADIVPPAWRGSAIGIYRFWRDMGYAIGALALGLVMGGGAEGAFWLVAIAMGLSGTLLALWGEETHRSV
jgi:MFS family permease